MFEDTEVQEVFRPCLEDSLVRLRRSQDARIFEEAEFVQIEARARFEIPRRFEDWYATGVTAYAHSLTVIAAT